MISPKALARLGANIADEPACAGPFKLTQRVAQDRIVLDRFAGYWNAAAIALDKAAAKQLYDGFVALGCVIRGDTIHFEIVSQESSRALMDLAVSKRFPLGNGIITVNTDAQAWARARAGELNKGGDAARAALAMLRIKRRLAKI